MRYPSQSMTIPEPGSLSSAELIETAELQELYAVDAIDRGEEFEDNHGTAEQLHVHFSMHYAGLGLEEDARAHQAVATKSRYVQPGTRFDMQQAIYESTKDDTDLAALRELASGATSDHDYTPIQMIDLERKKGIPTEPTFVEALGSPRIRTIANIVLSRTIDEAQQVRDDYLQAQPEMFLSAINKGARGIPSIIPELDLWIAATHPTYDAHRRVVQTLSDIHRPVVVKPHIYRYLDVLVGRRQGEYVSDVVNAIDRPGLYKSGYRDRVLALGHIAQTSLRADHLEAFKQSFVPDMDVHELQFYMSVLGIAYVKRGKLDQAVAVTKEIGESTSFMAGASIANIFREILPVALSSGALGLAAEAYFRGLDGIHTFVEGRLQVAAYLRNLAAQQTQEGTEIDPENERTKYLRGWLEFAKREPTTV